MKKLYYLVFPDDSGNDDGILGRKFLTVGEANELNQKLMEDKNEHRRWVKAIK